MTWTELNRSADAGKPQWPKYSTLTESGTGGRTIEHSDYGELGEPAQPVLVISLHLTVTTSVVGGKRKLALRITDIDTGQESFLLFLSTLTDVSSSSTKVIQLVQGATPTTEPGDGWARDFLPPDMTVLPGEMLEIFDRAAIDPAGDTMTVVTRVATQ